MDVGYAAVDVHYPAGGGARAAAVLAVGTAYAPPLVERTVVLDRVAEYRPGRFFERELPAVLAVLDGLAGLELVVVDGYVQLDPDGRPGLGAHLHEALGVPVVGVAKTRFRAATHAIEVVRGREAVRPLHVTAAGLPPERAALLVRDMAGPYRMPDALRRVDALSRGRSRGG